MKKKIVFLPYDFDTAIGINNEGALVFSYNLEDTDQTEGGADVYNGQQSVLWNNLRMAFADEIKAMYQRLRSTGALSYEKVEQMFEEHQEKWPEAIFNEDAFFKYLAPLVEEGSAAYLSMLQGSKAEQRKWWLYNRFRYLDSKYNAGDALIDVITIRGYAKANITVTPYADVYVSIKYGSYLVQQRAQRNQPYTLACPLDNVNDTEIYIYSASQLADVGDLSGLKVGYADFSMATKLQSLKIGDSGSGYSNGNLTELYLGNNELLRALDVRNCPNLTQAVDISGCRNIEHVYFDGTAITGLTLPNGGILKTLHLPGTITNLSVRNQTAITDFVLPSYVNITTLRLENVSAAINERVIFSAIAAGSRVRMIGFDWSMETAAEVFSLMDALDTMRGLDENGNNMSRAQMSGTIHVPSLTGVQLEQMTQRYPMINIAYEQLTSTLSYYSYDGETLLYTEQILNGGNGTYTGRPARASTEQNTFTFIGWSRQMNQTIADDDALSEVMTDRSVYAAYRVSGQTYQVRFYNGSTLLYTAYSVPYGSTANYVGNTPVYTGNGNAEDYEFIGWDPSNTNIQGVTNCYAQYRYIAVEDTITDSWEEILAYVDNGRYSTRYSVGDTKVLDLGIYGKVAMQIAAFDSDELADGTGRAHITWISEQVLPKSHRFNPALVSNYSTVQGDGWKKTGTNEWQTQNYDVVSHAIATWTITIETAGTFSVKYMNNAGSYGGNGLRLKVNDVVVENSYTYSSTRTYNLECEVGDTVTVYADFDSRKTGIYEGSVIKFSSTGAFDVAADIQKTDLRGEFIGCDPQTGTIGGWAGCELRTYLKETLLPAIPQAVRSRILTVTKYQSACNTQRNVIQQESFEDVWIPSYREISIAKGTSGNTITEVGGPVYDVLFDELEDTIKKRPGESNSSNWRLRSAAQSDRTYIINGYGQNYTVGRDAPEALYVGIVLGFCI